MSGLPRPADSKACPFLRPPLRRSRRCFVAGLCHTTSMIGLSPRLASLLLPLLPLLATTPSSAQAAQPGPIERLQTASDWTSITNPDSKPWHLKLTVTLAQLTPGAGVGTIEEWWNAPDKYRIAFDLPDYKATVIQNGATELRTPATEPPPLLPRLILWGTIHPMPRSSSFAGLLPEVTERKYGKVTVDCIALHKPSAAPRDVHAIFSTFCLAPNNSQLLLVTKDSEAWLRLTAGNFRGKQVPLELKIAVNGAVAISSHIEKLQGQAEPYDEVAQTDGLQELPDFPDFDTPGLLLGRLINGSKPTYPEFARQQHLAGEVLFDTVIGPDGHVTSVKPIFAADPTLVAAAKDAVQRWVYEPTLLNGTPTPIRTTVTVNFRMTR